MDRRVAEADERNLGAGVSAAAAGDAAAVAGGTAASESAAAVAEEPAPRFRVTLLGIAFLWAAMGVFMNSTGPYEGIQTNLAFARMTVLVFLLSGAATATVAALLAYRGKHLPARPVVLMGAFLLVMGMLLLALCFNQSVFDSGRAATCGLLVGISDTTLFLLWGRAYASLSPHKALFHSAIAIVSGTIMAQLVRLIPSAMGRLFVGVVLAMISLLMLHVEYGRNDDFTGAYSNIWPADAGRSGRLKRMMRFIGKPLGASIICALIAGIVWDASGAGVAHPLGVTIVGYLIAGVALCVLAVVSKARAGLDTFYQVVVPIAVLVLLIVPFLDFGGDVVADTFIGVANEVGVAFIDISIFAVMATASYALAVPSDMPFGIYRCLNAVVMSIAIVLQTCLSHTELRTLCLVVTAIYLVYVFVSGLGKPHDLDEAAGSSAIDAIANDAADKPIDLSVRCHELAVACGLSPREEEILAYLARGRGSTYISEELHISTHTVKTHAKRIHDKLGVHSREELLDLFER